jgi:hypothetical protein
MKCWKALALSLLLPVQGAAAQVDAGAEKFSCDTPGGHFSRYQRALGSAPVGLTANVTFNELRTGTDWLPVVNVMLNGGAPDKRAGFRLFPDRGKKKIAIYQVFPGMTANQVIPLGDSAFDAPLPLSISLSEQEVRLSATGTSRSGPALPGAQWSLDLSCSSVDALIDNISVKVGHEPS